MQRARLTMVLLCVALVSAAFLFLRRPAAPDAPAAQDAPPPGGAAPAGPAAPAPAPPPPAALRPFALLVLAPPDGRFGPEPCNHIRGGGLYSQRALVDSIRTSMPEGTPLVPILLGDLMPVGGDLGREWSAQVWNDVMADSAAVAVAVGPDELALGSKFLRGVVTRYSFAALCANAVDGDGASVLRGWALADAGGTTALLVATADSSTEDLLVAARSDVRLSPAVGAAARALADGRAEAKRLDRTLSSTVLFHHGTVEETAAVLRAAPGFTVAFATRGGDLPLAEPVDVDGVPVYYAGRGLRYAWTLICDRGVVTRRALAAAGATLIGAGSPHAGFLDYHARFVRDEIFPTIVERGDGRVQDPRGDYVGAQRCGACHTEELAAHAGSPHGRRPADFPDLGLGQPSCVRCHTTGAFSRTGWRGVRDTSDLGAVSCEACHGPGSAHAEKPESGWGRVDLASCRACHTPDRDPEFDAAEAWKKWGHAGR